MIVLTQSSFKDFTKQDTTNLAADDIFGGRLIRITPQVTESAVKTCLAATDLVKSMH